MSPLSESVRPWFECDHPGCQARYRRRGHLNRHLARHDQTESRPCPYCESILTRQDLLRRHIRTHHSEKPLPESRTLKACSPCRVRKERCDGGLPCHACQHRGAICVPVQDQTTLDQERANEDFCSDETNSVPQSLSVVDAVLNGSRWVGQDYIDIYFETFHPVWPFLHRSTFDLANEPCVLVQSIVMIGMWVKGSQKARAASMHLHDKLCTAIRAQSNHWCISDSSSYQNTSNSWPMTTYQSVLLNIILALFMAKETPSQDLSLRHCLPDDKYELLVSLVQSCRKWDMFSYPNMLAQHDADTPLALVWVTIEEIKRFALVLYKVCRLSTCSGAAKERANRGRNELLTLGDLSFCMPDCDEVWNATSDTVTEMLKKSVSSAAARDNRDPKNWISETSTLLHDARVDLDWI